MQFCKDVPWQPPEPCWISRSSVKGQGHMSFWRFSLCVCGYPRTVLSLEQGLMISLCLWCSFIAEHLKESHSLKSAAFGTEMAEPFFEDEEDANGANNMLLLLLLQHQQNQQQQQQQQQVNVVVAAFFVVVVVVVIFASFRSRNWQQRYIVMRHSPAMIRVGV